MVTTATHMPSPSYALSAQLLSWHHACLQTSCLSEIQLPLKTLQTIQLIFLPLKSVLPAHSANVLSRGLWSSETPGLGFCLVDYLPAFALPSMSHHHAVYQLSQFLPRPKHSHLNLCTIQTLGRVGTPKCDLWEKFSAPSIPPTFLYSEECYRFRESKSRGLCFCLGQEKKRGFMWKEISSNILRAKIDRKTPRLPGVFNNDTKS